MPNAGLDTRRESKEEVEKRVLEAEKVVVSNILYRWRKKWGMDYAILVLNGPDEVFSRFRIDERNKDIMREAAEELLRFLAK
jgi:hypothetical protein